jgi:hypothetical protein
MAGRMKATWAFGQPVAGRLVIFFHGSTFVSTDSGMPKILLGFLVSGLLVPVTPRYFSELQFPAKTID